MYVLNCSAYTPQPNYQLLNIPFSVFFRPSLLVPLFNFIFTRVDCVSPPHGQWNCRGFCRMPLSNRGREQGIQLWIQLCIQLGTLRVVAP